MESAVIGRTLSHYQVLDKIGEGGMGVVYKARDTELGRVVALKVLSAEALASEDRRRRFLQEARAASALNHPNIVTIHEIGHAEGFDFIVMEHVDGPSVKGLVASGQLPLLEAVEYARQIGSALSAAHAAGIVHRDIKPANILISSSGLVKVVDFGLAKLTERASISDIDPTRTGGEPSELTEQGAILGTVAYMSPEQAEGKHVDERSDVFSLGVVLYEMLTGRRPFQGDSNLSTLMAILRDAPPPLKDALPELAPEIERIAGRALGKKKEDRPTAAEVVRELAAWQQSVSMGMRVPIRQLVRRRRVAIPAAVALVALAGILAWSVHHSARVRWAKREAMPRATELAANGKFNAAFDLLKDAEKFLPGDPQFARLWPEVARTVSVETDPPGAAVYRKDYNDPDTAWRYVGKTPLPQVAVPRGWYLWKFSKEGMETSTALANNWNEIQRYKLAAKQTVPADMVFVPPGNPSLPGGFGGVSVGGLEPFLMDRYEVTNRQFKEFITKGGYQKREFAEFRDATGRPGPSTWEAGSYPDGKDDFPVAGVSWYEAAAYCEFAGKQLPTIYHWYRAADPRTAAYVVPASNFSGAGLARVGQNRGAGPFGTYDMAGNVREWCFNEGGDGLRYLLGGSWRDPVYQFTGAFAIGPLDRSDTNGFRCARYSGPVAEGFTAPRRRAQRDLSLPEPVSDEAFRAYRSLYSYDRGELKPALEVADDSSPHWKKQKVSFNAAYGRERVAGFLFLPKEFPPPYQAVIFFPGSGAFSTRSSVYLLDMAKLDFIIRSGRAAFYPVYYGSYEREAPPASTDLQFREHSVRVAQDLMTSVDYLETRSEIERGKLAYVGVSGGSSRAPVLLALEERVKVAVLFDGGLTGQWRRTPEVSPMTYAPRVKIPVLMLNGNQDYTFPVETSQKPLFRLLDTPERDKRHLLFDGAHDSASIHRAAVVREVLNWLDTYLGPVKQ